jgi:CRISPR/Cas system-associated exonuclease Cas4 (RecB family)
MTIQFLPKFQRFDQDSMDHSGTKLFKECPRKYFYRIKLGKVPKESYQAQEFAWGNSIHKFCEILWENGDVDAAIYQALKLFKAPPPVTRKPWLDSKRLFQTFSKLVEFYRTEVAQGRIVIEAIEAPFETTISDGTKIGGRFDQVIKMNGKFWIRDWKTTSNLAQYAINRLDPNDQATRYVYALSRLNGWSVENQDESLRADGITFIVIQNMASEKSLQLQQVHITKTTQELVEWDREQKVIYNTLNLYNNIDVWPKHENQCSFCDYKEVCKAKSDNIRSEILKDSYLTSPWKFKNVEQEIL